MIRITVASLVTVAVLAAPGAALAGGCEVLEGVRDRAECVARAEARDAARAEVQRQVGGVQPTTAGAATASRSAAWQAAIDEADGIDAGALLEPRPIAAVGGLAWFALVLRARRRRRTRAA